MDPKTPINLSKSTIGNDLLVVGSSGRYLACDPIDFQKQASGEFAFELDVDDDDEAAIRPTRLSIDLTRVHFGPEELQAACRDAELVLAAIRDHGGQVEQLVNTFKADPAAAARMARKLGLSEADFLSLGGGLWWLAVVALVVVASGCSSGPEIPRNMETDEPISVAPEEGVVTRPCGYKTQLIKGRIRGFGSSRTNPGRAARRAREDFRESRNKVQDYLRQRFAINCAPPCRPTELYWDDRSDAVITGTPGAGGGGSLFKVEFDTKGNFGFSIPGPSGGGGGGRVYASVTRQFTFQMACQQP